CLLPKMQARSLLKKWCPPCASNRPTGSLLTACELTYGRSAFESEQRLVALSPLTSFKKLSPLRFKKPLPLAQVVSICVFAGVDFASHQLPCRPFLEVVSVTQS